VHASSARRQPSTGLSRDNSLLKKAPTRAVAVQDASSGVGITGGVMAPAYSDAALRWKAQRACCDACRDFFSRLLIGGVPACGKGRSPLDGGCALRSCASPSLWERERMFYFPCLPGEGFVLLVPHFSLQVRPFPADVTHDGRSFAGNVANHLATCTRTGAHAGVHDASRALRADADGQHAGCIHAGRPCPIRQHRAIAERVCLKRTGPC